MQVLGMNLKTVEARRFQDRPQGQLQLRVDHNSHFDNVAAEADQLKVSFQFTTSYAAFGVVKIEGDVVLKFDGAGDAATAWTQTRNLPQEVAQVVHGAILNGCIPEAVGLAKTVRLPPPIPLPQVRMGNGTDGQATTSAAPADSPETA